MESNKEHGEGRSDVVVSDPLNSRVAVFEAKYSRTLENMDISCQEALRQIDSQMYASEFEDSYDHVFCYGISFFKKRCLIQKKNRTNLKCRFKRGESAAKKRCALQNWLIIFIFCEILADPVLLYGLPPEV